MSLLHSQSSSLLPWTTKSSKCLFFLFNFVVLPSFPYLALFPLNFTLPSMHHTNITAYQKLTSEQELVSDALKCRLLYIWRRNYLIACAVSRSRITWMSGLAFWLDNGKDKSIIYVLVVILVLKYFGIYLLEFLCEWSHSFFIGSVAAPVHCMRKLRVNWQWEHQKLWLMYTQTAISPTVDASWKQQLSQLLHQSAAVMAVCCTAHELVRSRSKKANTESNRNGGNWPCQHQLCWMVAVLWPLLVLWVLLRATRSCSICIRPHPSWQWVAQCVDCCGQGAAMSAPIARRMMDCVCTLQDVITCTGYVNYLPISPRIPS